MAYWALAGMLLSAFSEKSSADKQAAALKAQGEWENERFNFNAALADLAAIDSVERGNEAAATMSRGGRKFMGKQTVSYANQGVDISSGSARKVRTSTAELIGKDVDRIKTNALREAFGHRMSANDLRERGRMALKGAYVNADATTSAGNYRAASYLLQGAQSAYGNSGGKK